MEDVQKKETAAEQFFIGLVEVDLDRGVLPFLLGNIAKGLEDVPGIRTATHEYANRLLRLRGVVLKYVTGRRHPPVLHMAYLVDDLHLLNYFKTHPHFHKHHATHPPPPLL